MDLQNKSALSEYQGDGASVVPNRRLILRWASITALVLLVISVLFWQFQEVASGMADWEAVKVTLKGLPGWPVIARLIGRFKHALFAEKLLSPFFYAGIVIILTLERLFPVDPSQKLVSVSFVQDLVWMVLEVGLKFTVIVTYVYMLESLYQTHLSFLRVDTVGQLSPVLRFVWAILFSDFLHWLHHWVRHKVPWFWYFHTIHHSQRQLNMFTDFRYHVVEYLVSNTIRITALFIFIVDVPSIVLFALFQDWHTRLYHGNIKTNLGILRYVLVTPQSHRIHHSIETRHFDTNFGVLFSIWDRMFGTQYRHYSEYPATGIPDPMFPYETTMQGYSLILTPLAQLLYPFRLIGHNLARKVRVSTQDKEG